MCSYLALTSKADVARVEANTFICSEKKEDTVPPTRDGLPSKLGNWMAPKDMDKRLEEYFTGCMKGRYMKGASTLYRGIELLVQV